MNIISEDAERVVDQLSVPYTHLRGTSVLVTGATGMIGQYVIAILLECSRRMNNELRVIALARSEAKARQLFTRELESSNFDLLIGDVADRHAIEHLEADFVVHAASPATPDAFRADPVGVIHANVNGTDLLLDLLRQQAHGYLCFVSTMEIYGDLSGEPNGTSVAEGTPGRVDSLDLRSAYPESKRLAENLCIAYAAQYGVRSDIVRLSHTYGPGMGTNDTRVQADFVRKAVSGEDILLMSDGSLSRTYTYAADAASAIMYILLTAHDRSQRTTQPTAYNVADEDSRVSIRQLAETVLATSGRDVADLKIEISDPDKHMWSRVASPVYLDCSRVRSLGWRPLYGLDAGLARMVAHTRSTIGEIVQ